MLTPSTKRTIGWIFFAIAALVFLFRGPVRFLRSDFNDFSVPYVSARLWVRGIDPYQNTGFMNEWVSSGGKRFVNRGSATTTRPAYPPVTIVAISPFSFFNREHAQIVFLTVVCAVLGFILWRIRSAGPWLLGIILLFAPLHTGMSKGNLAILSIGLGLLAVLSEEPLEQGILLGIALCLKPQSVAWLWLYFLLRRKLTTAGTSAGVVVAAFLIALLRLPATWIESLKSNLSMFAAIGGVNDFTTGNPSRFELVNLQVPMYSITHDYFLSNLTAWCIAATLLAIWAILTYRHDCGLLSLSVVSLIGLLPVYQRYYGLVILLLPFAYLVRRREPPWKAAVVLLPFLIPWIPIAQTLSNDKLMRGPIYSANPVMQTIILPFATWFVVALVVIGLRRMSKGEAWEVSEEQRKSLANSL